MDVDDSTSLNSEELDLWRSVCDLEREMDQLTEDGVLRVTEPESNEKHSTGDTGSSSLQEPFLVDIDTLITSVEQIPQLPDDETVNDDLCGQGPSLQSGTERVPRIKKELITTSRYSAKRSLRSRTSKKTREEIESTQVPQSKNSAHSKCRNGVGQQYNLRRRSVSLKNEDACDARVSTGSLGTTLETCVATKDRVVGKKAQRKAGNVEAADLNCPSEPSLIAEVKTEVDCFVHSRTPTTGRKGRVPRLLNGRKENKAPNIGNVQPDLSLVKAESDGHLASSAYPRRVGSNYPPARERRRWTDSDWKEFFLVFGAMSAEAHTLQNLTTKKTQARRRWLSCMRNILGRPPI